MADLIHHPPHYTQHPSGIECIQITEHMNFTLGNAVKRALEIFNSDNGTEIEIICRTRCKERQDEEGLRVWRVR
jgi:hypothetical protein